ncbi:MAG: type II toxin-antitoxin system HipA family toxin [Alphaproteobacteria bacterium]|nr:type II toxin-antitoxin system HipA family toxin [Alphaproteobacteria bacterium]
MVVVANVFLWENYAGAVYWDQSSGIASFQFDPGFFRHGWDISPITMPISGSGRERIYSFPGIPAETYRGLPGFLADSLPDKFGHQLINTWLAIQGRPENSMNPVEMLCYMGKRAMGALEFRPATRIEGGNSGFLEISGLVDLAKKALHRKGSLDVNISTDQKQALLDIIRVGTSAGGARAKAVIALNKQNKVRSGQLEAPEGYTHWLIKLDGVTDEELGDPKGYGRIEYAYHLMVRDCGIAMTECRLLEENGRAHFMTRRFDRSGHNSKTHMLTLSGLCHYDYNNPLAYSYEQAFQAMRNLRLPYPDADQLYRRMVFNVIAANHDDHTKNISFLMDKSGQWRLSPAYDMTFAFKPSHQYLSQHQLSLNNKRTGITGNDLRSVAERMNIKKSHEITDQITEVVSRWPDYASMAGIPISQIKAIGNAHLLHL